MFMLLGTKSVVKHILVRLIFSVILMALFVYLGFDAVIQSSVIERSVYEGSGGRYDKLMAAIQMLSQDIYPLIGVPKYVQIETIINGVSFSDNSFGLLLISFGVIAIIPIALILYNGWRFSKITKTILPICSGLICFGTTNSILWDPWIFYYSVSLALIYYSLAPKHRDRLKDRRNNMI